MFISCIFVHQRPAIIGVRKEMRIADLIVENKTMKKFGIFLDVPNARIRVQDALERNNDEGEPLTMKKKFQFLVVNTF